MCSDGVVPTTLVTEDLSVYYLQHTWEEGPAVAILAHLQTLILGPRLTSGKDFSNFPWV